MSASSRGQPKTTAAHEAATRYTAGGLSVVPTRLEDKQPYFSLLPKEDGKRVWAPYQREIPGANPLRYWFLEHDACVAIVCGAVSGGLEVFDFDNHSPERPMLYDAWAELVEREAPGLLDRLPLGVTQHGGRHLTLRCPVNAGSSKLAQYTRTNPETGKPEPVTLIETKGAGGYFLAPPSPGYTLLRGDLAAIPTITPEERTILLEAARAFQEVADTPTGQVQAEAGEGLRPGDDYNERAGLGKMADLLTGHGWQGVGQRGEVTYWRRPGKNRGWSATLNYIPGKLYVFSANGDPFAPERAYDPFSVYTLLEHRGNWSAAAKALAAEGYGAPLVPTTRPNGKESRPAGGQAAHGAEASAEQVPPAEDTPPAEGGKSKKVPAPTDPRLAYRWLAAHPDTAWGLGEFRRYEGGIWPVVPLDVVRHEILGVLEVAEAEGIRPTAPRLASVMELGRVKISRRAELWDGDHDILVCGNGALHIPSRTLLPHSREHNATSRLPFDYDPAAVAGVWEYVLNRCAPDSQYFLQEFAGYALTTDTRYEIAVWLAGQPGGGKSTVLEGFQAMLGTRAFALGLADIEKSRFALTNLPGKTLAISTEQPGGYMGAAELLNRIISGERITVDRKFRDPVDIIPRVKLAWALNELPRVGPEGVGLFRRVKVIKFPPLPEAERDPNIKEQVKLEGAGILNWALDGLARLRERGRFEIPKSVQEATEHFRETNDVPAVFVAECCLSGDNRDTGLPYRTRGSLLYQAYAEWCKANGHKPASSTSVAEDWRRLGFEKYLVHGTPWWRYVGLVDTKAVIG